MILVDSSVWIDHLRVPEPVLNERVISSKIYCHPFIIGEIALGALARRAFVVSFLKRLPQSILARDSDVLTLIEQGGIYSLGIGYVDAHLLASVRLTPGTTLWTRDKRLLAAAEKIGVMCEKPER
jgi:predicted nucleic acid-binding protein